ncbi:hypothetical protein [Streptomyces sp. NPDC059398]|uniref:aromatic-ring hydroxylase C-terminal domain-containing protein n=1 Tax=Streptomyces sp. NPDC059398 TaxID=3346820 RepID=UPI00367BB32C
MQQGAGRQQDADSEELLQLGHTYRGGPLAPATGRDTPGPKPGDRAPDAPCHLPDGRPVRLFDLQRGGHWTLYGFGSGALPRTHAGVRTVEFGTDVTDTHGHAGRAYAAESGELVLVRPDGHVAARGCDPGAVTAYLDKHTGGRTGGPAPVPA